MAHHLLLQRMICVSDGRLEELEGSLRSGFVTGSFREQIPGGLLDSKAERGHAPGGAAGTGSQSVLKPSFLSRKRGMQIVFPYISMQAGGIMAEGRQGRGFVMVTGRWLRMWVERRSSRVSDLSKLELSHGQYDK